MPIYEYECGACGHRFLDSRFSDGELEQLYSRYYPRASFDPEQYRPHREPKTSSRAWCA